MTSRECAKFILDAQSRHLQDGDGGYGLVTDLVQSGRLLGAVNRERLRNELLRIVACREREMWGVALEALVQGWASEVAPNLAALVEQPAPDREQEAALLMGLLRLRYADIQARAEAHIRRRMAAGDMTVIPLLAALCRVDADSCLDLASSFFAAIIANGDEHRLRGYIPAVVLHFTDASDALAGKLIARMATCDLVASERLSSLIGEYLDRPYVIAELGAERVSTIKRSVLN